MNEHDLATRVAMLEDKEAIRLLKARYLRACDLKQPEVIRDCLHPTDARIAFQGFPEFNDRDAFVAVYEQMACQPGVYDIHHGTNWDITVDGDTAKGLFSLNFRTILMGPRQIVTLAVEYEDSFVRDQGRWWIRETISRQTSQMTEEVAEDGSVRLVSFGAPVV